MQTILIIEDDAALASGLCRALKSEDRTPYTAKLREDPGSPPDPLGGAAGSCDPGREPAGRKRV